MNAWGELVRTCWQAVPDHFLSVRLGAYVIMPNHIHGILVIEQDEKGAVYRAPTLTTPSRERSFGPLPKHSIHTVVNTFKGAASRQIHRLDEGDTFRWQRNYYEHIIRHPDDYARIENYILSNPQKWQDDQLWSE